MLRMDGEYKFYVLKTRSENYKNGEWYGISLDNHSIDTPEFDEFTASGRVWQTIGVHGTFDIISALKVRNQLKSKYPDLQIEVFRVEIKQEQTKITKSEEADILNEKFL